MNDFDKWWKKQGCKDNDWLTCNFEAVAEQAFWAGRHSVSHICLYCRKPLVPIATVLDEHGHCPNDWRDNGEEYACLTCKYTC